MYMIMHASVKALAIIFFLVGSSIIILYDKKILGDNLAYLSQGYISSHSVIERLQYHIDYVSVFV